MVGSIDAVTRREVIRLAAAAGASAALSGSFARSAYGAKTQGFDDGSSAIPGGLIGDAERVIIIGAGWAGLTLANALRNAGVDHVVLEARNRIGGRAYTKDIGGYPIDLGCSWIHQPIGNPMARFAEQAGIRRTGADVELDAPFFRFYDDRLRREMTLLEKVEAFFHFLNFSENEAGSISRELGPRASVRQGADVYLNRWRVSGDARRQAGFVIRVFSEFVYGRDWNLLSLDGWAFSNKEPTYFGIGEGDFPVGGYRGLTRAMSGAGEVRLRHRVRAVEVVRDGVIVRATSGDRKRTFRGSHVAVTVPLGVLKSGAIRFAPRLPADRRALIAAMGFGTIEKIALVFDKPFWSDLLHTHAAHLTQSGSLEFPYFVDLNRISQIPALIAFNGGSFADRLDTLHPDATLALALSRMRDVFGQAIPEPRAFAVTNWRSDPYSRGSYSNVLVGRTSADNARLGEPVAGRILFAGEATNPTRHSTADGALSSGVREAKRLLRRPAVTLSAG